ncbi:hypothetical protein PJL18_03722 [Paenarthrobacter nicotinovorans]|nr:hypothetical protein [Paenarthrobacter nicotinovorans]
MEVDLLDPVTVENGVGAREDVDVVRVARGNDDHRRSGRRELSHHLLLRSVAGGVVGSEDDRIHSSGSGHRPGPVGRRGRCAILVIFSDRQSLLFEHGTCQFRPR